MDQVLNRLKKIIKEHGWAVQGVMPDPDSEDNKYGYYYTVGMKAKGLPDLVVYSVPPMLATNLLNELAERMVKLDTAYETGDRPADLMTEGYSPIMVEVLDYSPLKAAHAFYEEEEFRAFQVVWPDDDNHYPWDSNYAAYPQRLLGVYDGEQK